MTKQIKAMQAALTALKSIDAAMPFPVAKFAIHHLEEALAEALAESALERMAENARELGLDYEQPAQTDWEAVAADQAMTIALLKAEQPAPVAEPDRVKFERHWRKTRGEKKANRELPRHPLQPQTYIQDSANRHWVTWQAAVRSVAPLAQQEPVIDNSCKDAFELIMKWADIYAAQTGCIYSEAAQDPSKASRMADERTILARVVAQTLLQPAQRKPLTDARIDESIQQHVDPFATYRKLHDFARAIEAAHGIQGDA